MSQLPKKIIFLFILSLLLIPLITPKKIYAQNPQDIFNKSVEEMNNEKKDIRRQSAVDKQVRINGRDTNDADLGWTLYNLSNKVMCTSLDPEVCNTKQTAMGNMTQLIVTLYTYPPASALAYTRDLLANAGLVKPVHAQGIGFAGLTPFLGLWKASRNIAYGVLIIVMVAIGFMIIFRMKIDPKTVISLQAALPKIVLTLIIITLSYPIVGFLIDLMYLLMSIIISLVLNGVGGSMFGKDIAAWQTEFMTADIGDLGGSVFSGSGAALIGAIWNQVGGGAFVGSTLAPLLTLLAESLFSWWFLAIPSGILALIFVLGALFTFIRLLLLLLNSYIQLLISVILGPLLLLQEAIPGKSAFTEWLLNIMANLVVFPATAAIFLFSAVILHIGENNTGFWAPPFIGIGHDAGGANLFASLLSLGIIFLSPNLVAQIKKAFHPKPTIPFTAGTALAPLTGGVQTAMGAASQFYYLKMTFPKLFGEKGPGH